METNLGYLGTFDYSKSLVLDDRDVCNIVRELRTASQRNPDSIRQLNLSHCRLDLMKSRDHSCLNESVRSFVWLSVVKINASGLRGGCMIALLYSLLRLPFMQGKNPFGTETARPQYTAEISLQNNEITDEAVGLLSEMENCFLRSSPAAGVKKVDLSYNSVTDRTVRMLASLTPFLTHLYLNGNQGFTGTNMDLHVTKFAPLSVLGMDKTGVDAHGVAKLMTGICKRKASGEPPIEVWMRGMLHSPNDTWCPLLNFCSSKGNANKVVVVKHDLQNGMGHFNSEAVSQHDYVLVRLFLNGWQPVEVKHFDVSADMPISRLAALVVNEVTAVCLEDMTRPVNAKARALQSRYCAALKHVVDGGTMVMKACKVDTFRVLYIHKFTDEVVVADGTGNELLGAPNPGANSSLEPRTSDTVYAFRRALTPRALSICVSRNSVGKCAFAASGEGCSCRSGDRTRCGHAHQAIQIVSSSQR